MRRFAAILALAVLASAQSSDPHPGAAPATPKPRVVETTYAYDAAGRLIEVVHAGARRQQYTYDAAGNLLSASTTALP
jgi:YD repeat-containing protein